MPDEDYLPSYGDTLCFKFKTGNPRDTMNVVLRVSTFEGIAMNAPVPEGVEQTADAVPIGWAIKQQWFQDDRKCYWLQKILRGPATPGEASAYLKIAVLDYAAEINFTLICGSDTTSGEMIMNVEIPDSLTYRRSTADLDNDGYTKWEEYRGFVNGIYSSPLHERLDNTKAELYFHTDNGYLDADLEAILESDSFLAADLIEFGPVNENYTYLIHNNYGYDIDRWFIDFKSRKWDDTILVENPLCTPPGLEDFPLTWESTPDVVPIADQALVIIDLSPYGGTTDLGATAQFQFIDDGPIDYCTNPYHFALYQGPGGCGGIDIWVNECETFATQIFSDTGMYHAPPSLLNEFKVWQVWRTIAHEFGHMSGINHHCLETDGPFRCVMMYEEPERDYPKVETLWDDSIGANGHYIGKGYMDDEFGCLNRRNLRP